MPGDELVLVNVASARIPVAEDIAQGVPHVGGVHLDVIAHAVDELQPVAAGAAAGQGAAEAACKAARGKDV